MCVFLFFIFTPQEGKIVPQKTERGKHRTSPRKEGGSLFDSSTKGLSPVKTTVLFLSRSTWFVAGEGTRDRDSHTKTDLGVGNPQVEIVGRGRRETGYHPTNK